MRYKRKKRKGRYVLFFLINITVVSVLIAIEYLLPGNITLLEENKDSYSMDLPSFINASSETKDFSNQEDQVVSITYEDGETSIDPVDVGQADITLKLLDIIPIKNIQVSILPNNTLIAGGDVIGISIRAKGLVIIDLSSFENVKGDKVSPGKKAGLKKGDIILRCNNNEIMSSRDFMGYINNSKGREVNLQCMRDGVQFNIKLKPERFADDSTYKVGLWVKDSTDGIGTMTFIDRYTGMYGALGHGINDSEVGTLFPVNTGEAIKAKILDVEKGTVGEPGELRGVFDDLSKPIGDVKINCPTGVYGSINKVTNINPNMSKEYKIGLNYEIVEGPAKILCTIDEEGIKEYDVYIEKVYRNRINSPKSMVIKIKDSELISKTGGIVQGMSGSPIIQNEKIIGAVTHVMVNDPTSGYGIFIESMLNNINKAKKEDAA